MEFRILGALEVEEDGRPVRLGGAKQRTLLAFLLLHANEVVSRDRLIDELWGDQVPETAATAVQVYVSQLRKVLGRDVIVTRAPGYLVSVQDGELDLARFEQLVAHAREMPPAQADEELRAALSLWRGPPLAELDASFASTERARLEEQRLGALEQRIEADLALGRHAQLVPELERLVHEHPLRERLRGQLMLALYRNGRQADALGVYRSGRRLLDVELGLEPGEDLRRLERAILEQDASLALPSDGAARPATEAPTGTVTFLFTDIESSTRLVQELGDEYGDLLIRHHDLVRRTFEEHGGQEIDRQGDALFFAFRRARDAVRSSVVAQLEFAATSWPKDADVRIRIGIHTGEPPGLVEGGYHGLDVVCAARISGAAHGGQILVSSATRDLIGAALPDVSFRDLGEHRLKSIEQTQRIFQVVAAGLREDFPPLRTQDAARVMSIGGRERELAVAAEAALETEERRVRLSRRSWLIAAAGALVLAAATTGVVLAVTGGSSAPPAVLPNSVAAVDPKSGRVVADVPIGGRPVWLAVGRNAIWVTNADDGTVSRIDPKTHEVVKTIGLGADVNALAVGFGSVWVTGGNDEKLFRIDARRNAVEATLLGNPDPLRPRPVFFVAAGSTAVWAIRGDTLLRIDPATNEVTARRSLPSIPENLGAGAGSVWVTTLDDHLVRIDEGSATITATSSLPGPGVSPAVRRGELWLIGYAAGPQLWTLDPNTLAQKAAAPFPSPSNPFALAVEHDNVWAIDNYRGRVWSVDPDTGRMTRVARLPFRPISVAAEDGAVWVGVADQPVS